MNLLQDNVRKLYFKYFGAAFGSAMVSSICGLVDTAVVGQSLGPIMNLSFAGIYNTLIAISLISPYL